MGFFSPLKRLMSAATFGGPSRLPNPREGGRPGDAPADTQKPPKGDELIGEQTARQASMIPGFAGLPGLNQFINPFVGGGALTGVLTSGTSASWLNGACGDPYAFGRWVGQLYWGSYACYRLILAHPRMRQARATLFMPIFAGEWEVEADSDVPEDIVQWVKDAFLRLRTQYVPDALRAADLGWAAFETVWELKDGKYVPAKLKPLLPDITTILVDDFGAFAGVQQGGNVGGKMTVGGTLDTWKSHIYTFDNECGNLYGRPLTENARQTAWRLWLDAAFQLHGIGEKLSEVIVMGFAPAGTYKDAAGNDITPTVEMGKCLAGLKDTGMAVFTNLTAMARPGMPPADMKKLAEASMSSLQFYDAGNHSAAIGGKLEQMQHAEDLMFASYLISSRTGMQAEHGSKSDSETHGDAGMIVSEAIDREIADNLSRTVLNQALTLNFGEQWRDKVRLRATPLVDAKAEMFEGIMTSALADPVVGPALSSVLDWDAIAKRAGVPSKEGAQVGEVVATAVEEDKQQKLEAAKAAADALKLKSQQPAVAPPAKGKGGGATAKMLSRWVEGETMPMARNDTPPTDAEIEVLRKAGHGSTYGKCGHKIKGCRCIHTGDPRLRKDVDVLCSKCEAKANGTENQ